jgi:hypothetical protein
VKFRDIKMAALLALATLGNTTQIEMILYCEQSPSHSVRSDNLFNYAACENHQTIYMKWQQVKVEWGIRGNEGESERESRLKE